MDVEIVRSARRSKTVQARLVGGKLRVAVPERLSGEEEAHWVRVMTERFERRMRAGAVDLAERARRLAAAHGLPEPSEIVWSERQKTRWASCSISSGRVRISSELVGCPAWVLDYVIVHELAHLVEAGHSEAFWRVVGRYRLAERARGYLIARGHEPDPEHADADAG